MNAAAVVSKILGESGLTKSALSASSGISRSLIDDYLKGRSQPSIAQLERLAGAAGCRLDIGVSKRSRRPASLDEFIAVLEFGERFPAKDPLPLMDMRPIWEAAGRQPHEAEAG